jgi:hypothetical protein
VSVEVWGPSPARRLEVPKKEDHSNEGQPVVDGLNRVRCNLRSRGIENEPQLFGVPPDPNLFDKRALRFDRLLRSQGFHIPDIDDESCGRIQGKSIIILHLEI